jgi:hypothetical protein
MPDVTDKAEAAATSLYKALDRPDELEKVTAVALLEAAQSAARGRPTPQAPMVAAGFSVADRVIRGPSGTLGEIAMGAEMGSIRFTQFGPRHARGSWLFPTLDNPPDAVEHVQQAWLDKVSRG